MLIGDGSAERLKMRLELPRFPVSRDRARASAAGRDLVGQCLAQCSPVTFGGVAPHPNSMTRRTDHRAVRRCGWTPQVNRSTIQTGIITRRWRGSARRDVRQRHQDARRVADPLLVTARRIGLLLRAFEVLKTYTRRASR